MLEHYVIAVSETLNHLTRRGIYLMADLDQGLSGSKSMLLTSSSLLHCCLFSSAGASLTDL